MSAEDLTNLLQRNPTLSNAEIAYLITSMQGIRDKLDSDESLELIVQASETRVRSLTTTFGTTLKSERTRQRLATFLDACMIRHIDELPLSYPLIDTKNSFGGVTFYPKIDHAKADVFHGGAIVSDGVGFITIADHSTLNPTTELTIAGALYLPATEVGDVQRNILSKGNTSTYRVTVTAHSGTPNRLQIVITTSGGARTFNYIYTPNTWFSFVVTYDSTNGGELWINGVSEVTLGVNGTISTNSEALGILDKPDGTRPLKTGGRLAWLHMGSFEADLAWAQDFDAGLLDTNDKNEITTYPFIGDAEAQPEASFGITR